MLGAAILLAAMVIASVATWPPAAPDPQATPMLRGARVEDRILAILDRSCRDCHSAAVRYPWYAYVAPVTLLIERDVQLGRQYLDLSRWHEYSTIRRQRALSGIANQVQTGGMPLDIYVKLHPEARLSEEEETLLFEWTQAERRRLILEARGEGR